MISKQEVMSLTRDEGMKIAVTVELKNKKTIEFMREDENNYSGLLHQYRFNHTALDDIFEKATDGHGILEGLKSIDEFIVYGNLTDEEVEQLYEQFNSIHSIGDVVKIIIQETTGYDPGMGVDYEKYVYVFSSLSLKNSDYEIENGILKNAPMKGDLVIPEGITKIPDSFFCAFDLDYAAHAKKAKIKSVVIPEGVTKICRHAFSFQDKLIKVQFPSTLKEIEEGAFKD